MCDPVTAALGIASAGSDAIAIGNKVEEKQREKEAKKATTGIQDASEEEINKQANQFGENGEVIITNKKQTTTQPQKRKQLISLRLNNPTETKTPTNQVNNNLGLNI